MKHKAIAGLALAAALALAPAALCQTASTGAPAAAPPATAAAPAPSAGAPAAPRAPTHVRRHRPADAPARTATDRAIARQLRPEETAGAVRTALVISLLTLIPALAVCMTPFVRIIVVLSMIRHAFGMPETPPNQVLVILALFLTTFIMMPTLTRINAEALQPFMAGRLTVEEGLARGGEPMREFMLRQVHDTDIRTIYEIARQPLPARAADVGLMQLTSAFMLNELRVSFKIGFVIFLPFLLIDLVVSAILLSQGMIMVPPTTLSLPIKILMFVLIDGWSLVLQGVVGSFR